MSFTYCISNAITFLWFLTFFSFCTEPHKISGCTQVPIRWGFKWSSCSTYQTTRYI